MSERKGSQARRPCCSLPVSLVTLGPCYLDPGTVLASVFSKACLFSFSFTSVNILPIIYSYFLQLICYFSTDSYHHRPTTPCLESWNKSECGQRRFKPLSGCVVLALIYLFKHMKQKEHLLTGSVCEFGEMKDLLYEIKDFDLVSAESYQCLS